MSLVVEILKWVIIAFVVFVVIDRVRTMMRKKKEKRSDKHV